MTQLNSDGICSPSDLGIAVYERVQELTQGRARKAAGCLSAITCLELDGREVPASPWCMLVLISLADLALHAPGAMLAIADWNLLYHNLARYNGEPSAQQMAAALTWAGSQRRNVRLEGSHQAVVACRPGYGVALDRHAEAA